MTLPIPIVVTPPAVLPVTLDTAKSVLRVTGTANDEEITLFLGAATEMAEKYTGRCFITRTLKLILDRFPVDHSSEPMWEGMIEGPIGMFIGGATGKIHLPSNPILSVTSITAYDDDNVATVVDPSTYHLNIAAATVAPRSGQTWPSGSFRRDGGVEVVYNAGYGASPSQLPSSFRTAILKQTEALFEGACAEMCSDAKAALKLYRILKL